MSAALPVAAAPVHVKKRIAISEGLVGGIIIGLMFLACIVTLPWTLSESSALYYDRQVSDHVRQPPTGSIDGWFGFDTLGRSTLGRCLLGGSISLFIGLAAAAIVVVVGTTVGMIAGFSGGWIDQTLMRTVDILYGLPYVLLVILFKIAMEPRLIVLFESAQDKLGLVLSSGPGFRFFSSAQAANLTVMFLSIGLVSWLTMARVVRGQVLSLREMPFIEACRAMGLPRWRVFVRHIVPNLAGPITVYAALTVPTAILQESFLSFLGIGVKLPLPTWGSLASEGVESLLPVKFYWWLLLFPCLLLMVALLSLNFLGDGLRDALDPKRRSR